MNRPAKLLSVVGVAAMLIVGLGAGSASAATKGKFSYEHSSDKQSRSVYDPKSEKCIKLGETGTNAYNGTDTTVVLSRLPSCSGVDEDTLVLVAGAKDTSGFKFVSYKFDPNADPSDDDPDDE